MTINPTVGVENNVVQKCRLVSSILQLKKAEIELFTSDYRKYLYIQKLAL